MDDIARIWILTKFIIEHKLWNSFISNEHLFTFIMHDCFHIDEWSITMYRGALSIVTAFTLLAGTGSLQAATTSGVMPVTATLLNSCIVAATPMAFGTISQLTGSATDSTSAITVTCTPGTNYAVGLDQGLHAANGGRHMEGVLSTDRLPYQLFSNPGRSVAWGNTVGTDTISGTATLLPAVLPVYGRIPANAPLTNAGVYADAVTVTVTF